jgi:hypothetical protein
LLNRRAHAPTHTEDRGIRLGLPQYCVAALVGITQSELCALENGRRPMTSERERAVREALTALADHKEPETMEPTDAIA